MATVDTPKLLARLDYLAYEIERVGGQPRYGGDLEHDLAPDYAADRMAIRTVLEYLAMLVDVTRDALTELTDLRTLAATTAHRQSAVLNGMDPDV